MFSIVIPAIRPDTIDTAIRSIRRQTFTDWQLIVVGQGANESIGIVTETVAEGDQRVRYLHIDQSGTCRARNAGFRAAQGEFISFIDDDCEAREDWLETIAAYFERHTDVSMVGGSVLAPPHKRKFLASCPAVSPVEAIYDPVATSCTPPDGFGWIGCNVSYRRKVLESLGPFDEYLGPGTQFPAAEDLDYALRMEKAGIKMLSTPKAEVIHAHGVRTGFQQMLKLSRNYAYGNAGLAGKLTLSGDQRGQEWVGFYQHEVKNGYLRKPYRLPIDARRLRHFMTAYELCVSNYIVTADLLRPRVEPYPG